MNNLFAIYQNILKTKQNNRELPANCYFMDDHSILSCGNEKGDARHPYTRDGLTLWAYSSGYITVNDSNYYLFPMTLEGKEPYFALYGGILNKDNKYTVFSLTGVADTEFGLDVAKYVIYKPHSALYIRVVNSVIFSVEISISKNKEVIFTIEVSNNSKDNVSLLTSAYVNPLLIHSNYESEETKWFRRSTITKDGAILYSVEDVSREIHLHNYAILKRAADGQIDTTSTRMLYVGDKNKSISLSRPLREGRFFEKKEVSQFIDSAIYGDIVKQVLKPGASLKASYRLSLAYNEQQVEELKNKSFTSNDKDFQSLEEEFNNRFFNNKDCLSIEFKGLEGNKVEDKTFNSFISKVIEQVDYCSRAKNSSLMMLGIRDIAQMLESMVMWNPQFVREKILLLFNYIDVTGRTPRQVSINNNVKDILIDSREFIDQAQFMISLVYKYVCYTNDISILNEKCGYITITGFRTADKVNEYDSLYCHLKRMIDYLVRNIDKDTNCLRTLYGDWNDAVDGLGSPSDNDPSKYGNGVSIMASFHMYQNLKEFIDIAKSMNEGTSSYEEAREKLYKGIREYGVVEKDKEKRIVHGWGNNRSFYVGSFNDVDNISRHSSTSNSFYVISGYYQRDPSLKDTVLNAFKHLEGRYGLMTFDKPFYNPDANKVGRIVNLPPGTAENAATYIHAAIYAIKALGLMDEGQYAYDQLMKVIPLTHEKISVSPFVMPNSYGYNPDLGIDGESMNDWYTGSSNTLLKALVDAIFGVVPQFDNKILVKPIYFPVSEMNLDITIKGRRIKLHYQKNQNNRFAVEVNGQLCPDGLIDLDKIKDPDINIEVR